MDQASEQSRKYEWLAASKILHQLLETREVQEDLAKRASVTELLAKSYFKAAFQSPTHEEFVEKMWLAESSYGQLSDLYQKAGSEGLSKRSIARQSFASYWLKENAGERRSVLEQCISLASEAANLLQSPEVLRERAETHRDILSYISESGPIAVEWDSLENQFEKGIEFGEQAIEEFGRLEDNDGLVEALARTLTVYDSRFDSGVRKEEAKSRAEQLLTLLEGHVRKTVSDSSFCLANSAACNFTILFEGDYSKLLKLAQQSIPSAYRTRDSYLIGDVLSNNMAAAWAGQWTEDSLERRRELFDKATSLYPDIIKNFEISANGMWLGNIHAAFSDIYTHVATFVEIDPAKKKEYLEKAVELARKGAAYQDYSITNLYQLSKALYFLAITETNIETKRKLLLEALPLREKVVRETDRLNPYSWLRGASRNYLALIKAELASITQDPAEKMELLRSAVGDQRLCVDIHRREWFSTTPPTPFEMSVLFRYLEWYGDIVLQLYQLTNEAEDAHNAVAIYDECIAYLRKLDNIAGIPAVRWKIAKIHDTLGDYKEACQAFNTASEEYKVGAKKLPSSEFLFKDLAQYMKAWSLIEDARLDHNEDSFLLAAENYSKAAEILQNTRNWNWLSNHYSACAFLEGGEALSRQERPEASVESFNNAIKVFQDAKKQLEGKKEEKLSSQESEDIANWLSITTGRERLCKARAELEQAKVLDRKGEEEASASKYHSASKIFSGLLGGATTERTRREVETLMLYSDAWAKMKDAETKASPALYAEAAEVFTKIEQTAVKKRPRLSALADAAICRALEHGTEFRRTRNTELYSDIKKELETATDYYQQAGLQNAADWAKATGKLFDALVYMADATSEKESKKKSEQYHLAEKHLQLSAKLYGQSGFSTKKDEVLKHLETAREEKELLLTPIDALAESPAITGTVMAPVSLVRDQAVGLERFETANVVGNLNVPKTEAGVGSELTLELELANVGQTAATLMKLENVVPDGLEIDKGKIPQRIEDNFIDLKGKRLEYLKTHGIKIPLRTVRKGSFQVRPRILFVDEKGNYRSYEFEPEAVMVGEFIGSPGHEREVQSLLNGLSGVTLSQFRVVGGYARHDETARSLLKDVKQKIVAGLQTTSPKHENYLIWSQPGGGKTFFVNQVSASIGEHVRYCEINLAETNESQFRLTLSELEGLERPSICFVDEIDSRRGEIWPYEVLLPHLEAQPRKGTRRVFVLAGSSGSSIGDMKQNIASRPKGNDLITRIPHDNEYTIPPMTAGDRILVTLANLKQAGREMGREIDEIEKLALYYVALNPRLANARQLRELAFRCVERIPKGEDRIKYDSLFDLGDQTSKEFWIRARSETPNLINSYILLRD